MATFGMILEMLPEVARLSNEEKLLLVNELWDTLAANPESIPVTSEQREEVRRRMEEYRRDPSKVMSWAEVKEQMQAKKRQCA